MDGDVVGCGCCGSVDGGSVRTEVGVGRERGTTRSPAEAGATGGRTRAPVEVGVTRGKVGGGYSTTHRVTSVTEDDSMRLATVR